MLIRHMQGFVVQRSHTSLLIFSHISFGIAPQGTNLCANVTCVALGQCHRVGVCDFATGVCTNPLRVRGNSNSQSCVVASIMTDFFCCLVRHLRRPLEPYAVSLEPKHLIHSTQKSCARAHPQRVLFSGVFDHVSHHIIDDGNTITVQDQCSIGVCAGILLCQGVTCSAKDQCHNVGSCDTTSGLCSDPAKIDGSACSKSIEIFHRVHHRVLFPLS